MTEKDATRLQLEALCGSVFSPSAPINSLSLFAGRIEQVGKLREAINSRGCHAMLFGDRGVGKTSLASILKELFAKIESMQIVKINCVESDDFQHVWRKALNAIAVEVEVEVQDEDGVKEKKRERYTLDQYFASYPQIGPGEIRQILQWASQTMRYVIVFDEFDRLAAPERGMFADTIKDLSDNSENVTLILVGVASDSIHLIAEHASITRCMRQIRMPLMNRQELMEIINKALPTLKMTIETTAANYIVSLSQGLPHYTHLLGKESALRAIRADRSRITAEDVMKSIHIALEQIDLTIRDAYHKAATGPRTSELFPQVLLACALANTDPSGYFRSSDVQGPLCVITGEEYEIRDFNSNLESLSTSPERGRIIERIGEPRKYKYRFPNPLLRPFIILRQLADEKLTHAILNSLLQDEGMVQPQQPTLF